MKSVNIQSQFKDREAQVQKSLLNWNDQKTKFSVYLLIALYLLLFIPFWKPVVLGFLFASALSPLVNFIRQKLNTKRKGVAYLTFIIGLLLLIGFLVVVALQIYSQIFELTQNHEALSGVNEKISSVRDQILSWTSHQSYLSSFNVRAQIDKAVVGLTSSAKNILLVVAGAIVSRTPTIILNFFVFILAFGAFLVMQPRIWSNAAHALRLGERAREHFDRFERICTLALGSVVLTAVLQATLVTIGSEIAGYDSIVTVFALTFLFALIPVVGAAAITVPLAIFSFIQGNHFGGVVLLITTVIAGVSDNILKGWLFSRAAKSNPAISIVTLLGGVGLFGFTGLFIAPVVEQLVMTYAFSGEGEPKPNEVTSNDRKAKEKPSDLEPRLV